MRFVVIFNKVLCIYVSIWLTLGQYKSPQTSAKDAFNSFGSRSGNLCIFGRLFITRRGSSFSIANTPHTAMVKFLQRFPDMDDFLNLTDFPVQRYFWWNLHEDPISSLLCKFATPRLVKHTPLCGDYYWFRKEISRNTAIFRDVNDLFVGLVGFREVIIYKYGLLYNA